MCLFKIKGGTNRQDAWASPDTDVFLKFSSPKNTEYISWKWFLFMHISLKLFVVVVIFTDDVLTIAFISVTLFISKYIKLLYWLLKYFYVHKLLLTNCIESGDIYENVQTDPIIHFFVQCFNIGSLFDINLWLVCDLNRTPIVMAIHWGSCVHFSGISTCGRTSRETVSHPQRQPLPTPYNIALPSTLL